MTKIILTDTHTKTTQAWVSLEKGNQTFEIDQEQIGASGQASPTPASFVNIQLKLVKRLEKVRPRKLS